MINILPLFKSNAHEACTICGSGKAETPYSDSKNWLPFNAQFEIVVQPAIENWKNLAIRLCIPCAIVLSAALAAQIARFNKIEYSA
jgi:hypothetical protein